MLGVCLPSPESQNTTYAEMILDRQNNLDLKRQREAAVGNAHETSDPGGFLKAALLRSNFKQVRIQPK